MSAVGLDSNVLIYAAGLRRVASDDAKVNQATTAIDRLRYKVGLVAPIQALGETYAVLVRNNFDRQSARYIVSVLSGGMATPGSSRSTLEAALDIVVDHKLQLWDALILAAAGEAGCALLLSEDMQDGFTALGVTVVNPFAAEVDRRLARLLA